MKTLPFGIEAAGHVAGRIARFALVVVLALAVADCSKSSSGGGSANMRVFNAILDGGAINVTVATSVAATALPFEGLTTYHPVIAGVQEVKVIPTGTTSPIVDSTQTINGGVNYTYILFGTETAPIPLLVQDALAVLTAGQFGVRVTNAAFGNAAVDLYLTAPGAPIDGVTPNIANATLGQTTAFAILNVATLQVRFTLHNSKQVIYDGGNVPFANGVSYALVPYTKGSGTLVNAALMLMDTAGNGSVINSALSEFKLIHAAPLTPTINATVNGVVAFANVPYQGITSYGLEGTGTQTVTIDSSAAPGAIIATAQPAFAPATDTSVVVTGLPGAQTALVFNDDNLPGTPGSARVRVINVAPNLGAVDVLVNFSKKVSALATNNASPYFELVDDTYTINFDLAGTTTVVLNLPAVVVVAGHTYTLYLMGTPNALAGILTRDD